MARLTILSPLDAEFFGGTTVMTMSAVSIFDLVRRLGDISPGFADVADVRAAFAVEGVIVSDWSAPICGDPEVLMVPRIGGGAG